MDEWTNLPQSIIQLTEKNLHLKSSHPVGIMRSLIESRLQELGGFTFYNDFEPVVTTKQNFDNLGFPADHPGRSKTDTYYINKHTLLRTHTSAHELECFQACPTPGYLISADVYRRDTIDKTHYPAFHQMEGARVWSRTEHGDKITEAIQRDLDNLPESGLIIEEPIPAFNAQTNPKQDGLSELETQLMVRHLQRTLELLMAHIFTKAKESALAAGNNDPDLLQPLRARWIEAYFPWTAPSFEIEIWWKGEWLEMLGCGIVRDHVLENSGAGDKIGWAFGIGLERSAMILFGIPDIRLFWSTDNRFLHQFKPNTLTTFKLFSKYPGTLRDVAFWVNDTTSQDPASVVHINELMEIVRGVAGDLVENVSLIDEFKHPKTGRISQCYRVNYQAMDRSLTNIEINKFQREILKQLVEKFPIELR